MDRKELREAVKRLGPLRFEGGPFDWFLGLATYRIYRTTEGVPYSIGKNRRGWALDLIFEEVK